MVSGGWFGLVRVVGVWVVGWSGWFFLVLWSFWPVLGPLPGAAFLIRFERVRFPLKFFLTNPGSAAGFG